MFIELFVGKTSFLITNLSQRNAFVKCNKMKYMFLKVSFYIKVNRHKITVILLQKFLKTYSQIGTDYELLTNYWWSALICRPFG